MINRLIIYFHVTHCQAPSEMISLFVICLESVEEDKSSESGHIVRLQYVPTEFIGIHNISISPEGINHDASHYNLFAEICHVCVRRCSMFWNHTSIDSINQYYHGNVVRALLPLRPVEGKGNYAGTIWERGS